MTNLIQALKIAGCDFRNLEGTWDEKTCIFVYIDSDDSGITAKMSLNEWENGEFGIEYSAGNEDVASFIFGNVQDFIDFIEFYNYPLNKIERMKINSFGSIQEPHFPEYFHTIKNLQINDYK